MRTSGRREKGMLEENKELKEREVRKGIARDLSSTKCCVNFTMFKGKADVHSFMVHIYLFYLILDFFFSSKSFQK